jgi:hypothetical protein
MSKCTKWIGEKRKIKEHGVILQWVTFVDVPNHLLWNRSVSVPANGMMVGRQARKMKRCPGLDGKPHQLGLAAFHNSNSDGGKRQDGNDATSRFLLLIQDEVIAR